MSELKKILEEVKVEWKFLADEIYIEIANSARKPIKASLRSSGNTPYYGANNIQDYVEGKTHSGEYVLIAEDGSSNLNNYSIQYAQGDFWANNHVHVLRGINGLNTKFLFHCLKIVNFIPYLTGGERAKLTKGNLLQIQIPIPCPDNPEKSLKIQQEIVRILDRLSEETNQLNAALQKELVLHQKQYDFYREELFKFEGKEVEWKSLGEVGDVTKLAGYEFTKYIKYSDTGKIIALRGLNVKSKIDLSNVKYIDESDFSKLSRSKLYVNDMLFTYVGTIGEIALIDQNDKYYLAPNVSRIRFLTNNVLPRYMFFYFKTNSFTTKQVNKYLANSSMKNLTMENIRKFRVPIPLFSEQERIVKILDDFDVKTKDITKAIHKEISLRNKQYQYYRDRLLSFPSLQNEVEALQ